MPLGIWGNLTPYPELFGLYSFPSAAAQKPSIISPIVIVCATVHLACGYLSSLKVVNIFFEALF